MRAIALLFASFVLQCSAADKPRIVFVAGEYEYQSRETIPAFARELATAFEVDAIVLKRPDDEKIESIPGLEKLAEADLLVLFVRRMTLPEAELARIKKYVDSGKPIVATNLLTHTLVGTSGHFHTHGRVSPAGSYTDGYLGQLQRTAIVTVVFGEPAAGGFSDWSDANAPGQTADQDHDLDGVPNGVEYFMGETGSTFTINPGSVAGTITWLKNAEYSGTYQVQTSPDLVSWTDVTGSVVDDGSSVEYTIPTGMGKLFVRLVVVPD